MNQQRKKAILTNPLKLYQAENPNATETETERLINITRQYQKLKKQLKDKQAESKAISKKIGEAKRKGESIDSLKGTMQTQSTQVKQLNKSLKALEQQLLECFKIIVSEQEKPSADIPGGRTYRSANIDIDQISISLLADEIEEWNAYVATNPAASIYHRAEWRRLISKTFGHDGIYCIARNEQHEIVGILPLIRLKSRLFGDFLVSMPYFNYGGAVADHPFIEEKLMAFANNQADQIEVSHVEYRDDITRHGLPSQTHKVNMMLSLPADSNILWDSFSSKLRAQINRPYRENPQVHFGGKELLDDFYTVFTRNMRDLGTPVYAKNLFINILNTFPDESTIICVKMEDKPVAAGFLLNHGEILEIPWASTIKSVNHLSMNMLMYWEVLQFAIKQGVAWFDFGRSTIDGGTFRFKRQWGAQPKQLHWHYWLNKDQELPSLNPSNPKYALMIALWKKMPVPLTKLLGPPIVKNLP